MAEVLQKGAKPTRCLILRSFVSQDSALFSQAQKALAVHVGCSGDRG